MMNLKYKEARLEALHAFEAKWVRELVDTFANVSEAARQAGIDRVYLHRLMRRHDIALTHAQRKDAQATKRKGIELTEMTYDAAR
jgi:DNA-binding NtrC family response regulator